MSIPVSPIRVVMNAFFAAVAADGFSNQKPINRYEQSADELPAGVEQQEVVGENEKEHREDEEVQVARRSAGNAGRRACS